jgi:endonuclease-3
MDSTRIRSIFLRLQAKNPQPTTELVYHSPFELLIAVILSAQATDVSVNKATAKLYAVANTPQALLELGLEGLKSYIKTIGLYNTKAANIMTTCQILLNHHQGQVPNNREHLEALAGVGRKTANVVLNTAFGQPTIAVDTHIFRVANRLGLAQSSTVEGVEKQLLQNIPNEFKLNAHHWLILHGRYVCTARKPQCAACLLADMCPSVQI